MGRSRFEWRYQSFSFSLFWNSCSSDRFYFRIVVDVWFESREGKLKWMDMDWWCGGWKRWRVELSYGLSLIAVKGIGLRWIEWMVGLSVFIWVELNSVSVIMVWCFLMVFYVFLNRLFDRERCEKEMFIYIIHIFFRMVSVFFWCIFTSEYIFFAFVSCSLFSIISSFQAYHMCDFDALKTVG